MNHDKDLPRVYKALSAPEQAELQRENAELKAQLNEFINVLRNIAYEGPDADAQTLMGWALDVVDQTPFKSPAQSLHDFCAKCTSGERGERDREIAERVREAVAKAFVEKADGTELGAEDKGKGASVYNWLTYSARMVRNLDLSEAIKDV